MLNLPFSILILSVVQTVEDEDEDDSVRVIDDVNQMDALLPKPDEEEAAPAKQTKTRKKAEKGRPSHTLRCCSCEELETRLMNA